MIILRSTSVDKLIASVARCATIGREPRIPSDPPVSVQRIHDNWRLKFRATVIGIGEEILGSVKTSTPGDLLVWRLMSGSACSLFIFEKIPYGSRKKIKVQFEPSYFSFRKIVSGSNHQTPYNGIISTLCISGSQYLPADPYNGCLN